MSRLGRLRIVIAEDDADDRMLIEDAFEECGLGSERDYVEDGVELLQYLRAEGEWSKRSEADLPAVILLDLNMPRMDGWTALERLKADPVLRRIPVVVLTTSEAEKDILGTYDLGVNSFITKPVTFEGHINVVRALNDYWIKIVQLPSQFEYA